MAPYMDYTVPVPESDPEIGTVTIKRIAGTSYVYLITGRKVSEAGNRVPINTTIGKLKEGTDPPLMYPNYTYTTKYPDNFQERVGVKHAESLIVGPYLVLKQIVTDYHLDTILTDVLHDADKAALALDIAAYQVLKEDNVMKYYPDYTLHYMSLVPKMRVYSDATVSRFIQSLDESVRVAFLNRWMPSLDVGDSVLFITDSTNKGSSCRSSSLAKFGKAKVRKGLPIINYAISIAPSLGLPVYYETYPGNVNDVTQFSQTIDNLHAMGLKSVEMVQDRGYQSLKNLRQMVSNGMGFTIILKGYKKLAAELKLQVRGSFEDMETHRVPGTSISATTVRQRLNKKDSYDCYFHVFYDGTHAARGRRIISEMVDTYAEELKGLVGSSSSIDSKYGEFFNLEFEDSKSAGKKARKVLTGFSRDTDAIQSALDDCGYFIVVSTVCRTAAEAYERIRVRDLNEKVFSWDKSFLGCDSERGHSDPSIRGRLFLEFLALILRCAVNHRLQTVCRNRSSRLHNFTVRDVFSELSNVTVGIRPDMKYHLQYHENTTVRDILDLFGVRKDAIEHTVMTINYSLGLSSTPPTDLHDEDPEKGIDRANHVVCTMGYLCNTLTTIMEEEGLTLEEIRNLMDKHMGHSPIMAGIVLNP